MFLHPLLRHPTYGHHIGTKNTSPSQCDSQPPHHSLAQACVFFAPLQSLWRLEQGGKREDGDAGLQGEERDEDIAGMQGGEMESSVGVAAEAMGGSARNSCCTTSPIASLTVFCTSSMDTTRTG